MSNSFTVYIAPSGLRKPNDTYITWNNNNIIKFPCHYRQRETHTSINAVNDIDNIPYDENQTFFGISDGRECFGKRMTVIIALNINDIIFFSIETISLLIKHLFISNGMTLIIHEMTLI